MNFTVNRENLLKPLSLVTSVVERRQTMPILSNVLFILNDKDLTLTGTDLEVEIVGHIRDVASDQEGEFTVPAKKLLDICKSLPENADLNFQMEEGKATIKSGRSRFTLATLPASEFPNVEESPSDLELSISQGDLKRLIDRTAFAMAQQDVRYYLNGMLWELSSGCFKVVSTDGHRLALSSLDCEVELDQKRQIIVPRKGITELSHLLFNEKEAINIVFGTNHIQAKTQEFTFTSKLIDGKFPDYERVVPKGCTKTVYGSRQSLRQSFARASILSNEKYRGIRLLLKDGLVQIIANNPEQEEAEEMVAVDYEGEKLEIGFNVSYLVDVLTVLPGETVKISLSDSNSSALLEEDGNEESQYVVMPMRL